MTGIPAVDDYLQEVVVEGTIKGIGWVGKSAYEALVAHHDEMGHAVGDLYRKSSRNRDAVDTNSVQTEYHIDEVFVVLARLGERLLALDLLDIDILNSARSQLVVELQAGPQTEIRDEFAGLPASLQYLITGALYFCAACHPNVIYRGFGAGVWDTWSWGCPDPARLPKAKKHLFGKNEPAPQITTLPDFDALIVTIKSHGVRDSVLKEYPRGISRNPPVFSQANPKDKDYLTKLKLLKDFSETLDKRGCPVPKDGSVAHVARWQIPYSTWHSQFSSQDQKNHSWEDVISYQMDAGKILYAFTIDRRLDLPDDEVLVLPPASAAEQLCDWLHRKPGMTHRVLKWEELETEVVVKNLSRSTRKFVGRDPLPNRFAFRDPGPATKNLLYRFQSLSLTSPGAAQSPNDGSQTQLALAGSEAPPDYFTGGTKSAGSPEAGSPLAQGIYEASYASPLHSPRMTPGVVSPAPVPAPAPETAVKED